LSAFQRTFFRISLKFISRRRVLSRYFDTLVTTARGNTMLLQEILQDIHGLDAQLQVLERQYGLLSEDFYMLYRLGEIEQSRDVMRWIGYYELRQERQQTYRATLSTD
jgi:hypothetical protein